MKTGIIYCPKHAGLKSATKRWQKISNALESCGIEYDLVQSENAQSVERLVNMMIHNGYSDIIIVGGDSALNDAVNCLMNQEKSIRDGISLGVIPNGLLNDFASFWGITEKNVESAVRNIKAHRVKKIDIGRVNYTDKNGKNINRYFLNCVNVGLIAAIQNIKKKTRQIIWSRKATYIVSLILLLFQKMGYTLKYTINYETEKHNIMTVCIGNALGYGQTPNAVPYNGMLDVSVIKSSPIIQELEGISLYLMHKMLNNKQLLPYRCREVSIEIKKGTPITVDGRPITVSSYHPILNFGVEQESVNFIIETL